MLQVDEVSELLTQHEVTSLMLRNTSLTDALLEKIVKSLNNNNSLKYVNVNCNNITSHGIDHLLYLLEHSPSIDSLSLVHFFIYYAWRWKKYTPVNAANFRKFKTLRKTYHNCGIIITKHFSIGWPINVCMVDTMWADATAWHESKRGLENGILCRNSAARVKITFANGRPELFKGLSHEANQLKYSTRMKLQNLKM
jgi:hypothetical protein